MIYILLLSLWPVLNYIQLNFEKLNSYKELSFITVFLFLGSFLSVKLIDRFLKKGINSYLFFLLIGFILFFNFEISVDLFSNSYTKASYLWGITALAIMAGAWKISSIPIVQKIARIIIAVSALVPLVSIGISLFSSSREIVSNTWPTERFVLKHKPNIYYILVDAYGRQDTLKEVADFDNEPFLKALEKRGFIVSRNAYSNYHFTNASLSATMNMHYHPITSTQGFSGALMGQSLQGNNPVRKILKDNNFKIINIPAQWQEISGYKYKDVHIENNVFEVYQSFFSSTPLKCIGWRHHYVNNDTILNTLSLFPGHQKFVFAHLAQVHDAIYDEKGNFTSGFHSVVSNPQNSSRYISSIKEMNRNLLNLVDDIKKNDPRAIIVIQSDHGPTYIGNQEIKDPTQWLKCVASPYNSLRLKKPEDFRYAFGILSAVYLPDYDSPVKEQVKKYLSGKSSLINTFRCIFSYLSRQSHLNLLKDDSHYLYWDEQLKMYKEADIRELKKGENL